MNVINRKWKREERKNKI